MIDLLVVTSRESVCSRTPPASRRLRVLEPGNLTGLVPGRPVPWLARRGGAPSAALRNGSTEQRGQPVKHRCVRVDRLRRPERAAVRMHRGQLGPAELQTPLGRLVIEPGDLAGG